MTVEVEYTEMELMLGALSGEKKLQAFVDEHGEPALDAKMESIGKEVEMITPMSKAEMNIKIALDNGISVETLINSPNYRELVQEFKKGIFSKATALIEKELNLDHREATAFMLTGLGILK